MPLPAIKSKPVYSPLVADTSGRHHLMVGTAEGATAVLRVLGELAADGPGTLERTEVLYAPQPGGRFEAFAEAFAGANVRGFDDDTVLLGELRSRLDRAVMGTRLYIAGPESFIGRVLQIALRFDLNQDEIRAEELGTLARRVHCVHCRTVTSEVRTNIVKCSGCGRWLTVRDHYSRRLAAYMGVMADAEAPGELPPVQELFP